MSRQEIGGYFLEIVNGRDQDTAAVGTDHSCGAPYTKKREKLTEGACGDPTPAPMHDIGNSAFSHTTLKPSR